jgi:hypothetical protein
MPYTLGNEHVLLTGRVGWTGSLTPGTTTKASGVTPIRTPSLVDGEHDAGRCGMTPSEPGTMTAGTLGR